MTPLVCLVYRVRLVVRSYMPPASLGASLLLSQRPLSRPFIIFLSCSRRFRIFDIRTISMRAHSAR